MGVELMLAWFRVIIGIGMVLCAIAAVATIEFMIISVKRERRRYKELMELGESLIKTFEVEK